MSAPPRTLERPEVVEADLTWTGEALEPGIQVAVDASGRIEAAGRLGRPVDRRLQSRALFPGFVSAHSHAFQRGLRGHGERFPEGAGSFWTWREAMYGLVETLDTTRFRALCLQAFREMRDAGITTVGEFHYLHHGRRRDDHAFDRLILEAAREAEIRIVLLQTCYRRGGVDRPLEPTQRRFGTPTDEGFWESVDRRSAAAEPATQAVGVAAHSLRAVSLEDVVRLHRESVRRGLVFHLHVEEQRRELDECLAVYGKTPTALLADALEIDGRFTAVHCTHTGPADLTRLAELGACLDRRAAVADARAHVGEQVHHRRHHHQRYRQRDEHFDKRQAASLNTRADPSEYLGATEFRGSDAIGARKERESIDKVGHAGALCR